MEDLSEKADIDWLALDSNEYDDICLDMSDGELSPLVMDVGPPSPILGKPSVRMSKVAKDSQDSTTPLSPVTSEASIINASQDDAGALANTDAPRSVKISDTRNVEEPKKKKMPLKRSGAPIRDLTEKRSNTDSHSTPCIQNSKPLVVGSPAINKSVCDDDSISLYAKDEDCLSLYKSNSKQTRVQSMNRKPFRSAQGRNVVARKGIDLRSHARLCKPDLRNTIKRLDNVSDVASLLFECNRMLNTNSYENVVIAAERFCKAYTEHVFQKGSQELEKFARRLARMLLSHKEMKYLYRVVRLSITMNIHLDEETISDFVESLCSNKEFGKANIILTQMRDASLVLGDRVKDLLAKYIDTPARHNTLPSKSARIVTDTDDSLCRGSYVDDTSQLPDDQNDEKKSGVLDAVSHGPTGLNWKKSQLFVELSDIHHPNKNRVARIRRKSDSDHTRCAATSAASGIVKITSKKEAVDFIKLGKCVTDVLEAVGGLRGTTLIFPAFADLIVSTGIQQSQGRNLQNLCSLDSFVVAAIDHANDKERIKLYMSRICIEVSRLLPSKLAYQVARYMERVGLKLVPQMCDGTQTSRKTRFFSADAIVNNCLEYNDLNLAMVAVNQYFAEAEIDFGPYLSPLVCKMLCKVAEVAYAEKRHMDAAKCCTLLPAGFGDGSEAGLMEEILLEILKNPESLGMAVDEQVCNGMVDQMLTRGLSTEIRKIIVKAFSANVVPVFKFLERKGIYRKPQIANFPHLILIPYILCVEEMAMIIQRHLTELSEFLVETGQSVCVDIPMKIVLTRSVGSLRTFSPMKMPKCDYKNSLTRLLETLNKVVTPSLKRQSQEFLSATEEFQINIDISSVRSWMLENTNYREGSTLKQA